MAALRKVLFATLVILGLALLVAASFLVEAHVEMRGIERPLPEREALLSFYAGSEGGPVRVRYVESGVQQNSGGPASTTGGFLLEWANGRTFAIDLGMDHAAMRQFGKGLEIAMGASPVVASGSLARQIGTASNRIEGVGLTHLHIDHTQGALDLCVERDSGPIPTFHTPDQLALENYTTSSGRGALMHSGCLLPTRLASEGPLYEVPGFPGLAAFAAGGHTPGSTAFAARIGSKLFLFAGDITNRHDSLMRNLPKGFVYSYLMIPENTSRLDQLRRWLAGMHQPPEVEVIVSHDRGAIEASGIPFLVAATSGVES